MTPELRHRQPTPPHHQGQRVAKMTREGIAYALLRGHEGAKETQAGPAKRDSGRKHAFAFYADLRRLQTHPG